MDLQPPFTTTVVNGRDGGKGSFAPVPVNGSNAPLAVTNPVECSLSRGARRHGAHHIDEHFTRPAGMRAGAGLGIAMSPIKRDVLLHPHVRIKTNYCETDRDGTLVGEVEKGSAVAPSLFGRAHRDAVDEEVVATLFQHGDPDVGITARQEPHFAALDPRAIVLLGW